MLSLTMKGHLKRSILQIPCSSELVSWALPLVQMYAKRRKKPSKVGDLWWTKRLLSKQHPTSEVHMEYHEVRDPSWTACGYPYQKAKMPVRKLHQDSRQLISHEKSRLRSTRGPMSTSGLWSSPVFRHTGKRWTNQPSGELFFFFFFYYLQIHAKHRSTTGGCFAVMTSYSSFPSFFCFSGRGRRLVPGSHGGYVIAL